MDWILNSAGPRLRVRGVGCAAPSHWCPVPVSSIIASLCTAQCSADRPRTTSIMRLPHNSSSVNPPVILRHISSGNTTNNTQYLPLLTTVLKMEFPSDLQNENENESRDFELTTHLLNISDAIYIDWSLEKQASYPETELDKILQLAHSNIALYKSFS